MKLFFLLFLILFFNLSNVFSQYAFVTAGGNTCGQAGSVSYTFGQVVFTTHSSSHGSVAEGVQQAYGISLIAPALSKMSDSDIRIYPNPTKDFLTLEVANLDKQKLTYHIYDFNGRFVKSENISQPKTIIDMTTYVRATYFLYIENEKQILKTFKIIKN